MVLFVLLLFAKGDAESAKQGRKHRPWTFAPFDSSL